MYIKRTIYASILISLLAPYLSAQEVRVASWNIEHLAEHNKVGCVPRSTLDYEKLRNFSELLNADVIALQEVENTAAVERVFPKSEWNIVLSDRPNSRSYNCRGNDQESTQQRVAVVLRKGIKYQNKGSFEELGLKMEGLRYGVVVEIFGDRDTINLLALHLKSGCFVDDYSTSKLRACEVLETQIDTLDDWIENSIRENKKFIVLGDFNSRLTVENSMFWNKLVNMDNMPIGIQNGMQNLTGCHPRYPDLIDHIILGPETSKLQIQNSQMVHFYSSTGRHMAEEDMLSDHCPVSLVLRL
jgi:endonuclease/exonuclease/phosphatase family metal-dependent hydrolase